MQRKQSKILNLSPNSRKPLKTTTTICRSSGPYYSHAFKCWRVEIRETEDGGSWQKERVGYLEIERKEDADNISVLLRAVKKFSDFELLISTVRDKVMAHSKTKGTCYAWGQNHRGVPLHKVEG